MILLKIQNTNLIFLLDWSRHRHVCFVIGDCEGTIREDLVHSVLEHRRKNPDGDLPEELKSDFGKDNLKA